MQVLIAAVLITTAMAVYFPLVFIRKMNKVMSVLERIEKNTSSAGSAAGAGH